jgi:hypothetical protein
MAENYNRIFAENGGKTAISDIDYDNGWDFIGDNPPEVEDFNSVMNEQDRKLLELKTDGVASWDAGVSYFANRSTVTGGDGNLYKCKIDNAGVEPVGDVTGAWVIDIVVTTSGSNANGDYRVWSDGTIEQWGIVATGVAPSVGTFPIPFTAASGIKITGCGGANTAALGRFSIRLNAITTTQFTVDADATVQFTYYAKGS